jgi:SAM-dependent methyltransferase
MTDWLSSAAFLRTHAATYDEQIASGLSTALTVDFLRALAGPGRRALELGVGTGRVALALATGDVLVTGVDNSPEMLALLAAKDVDGRVDARQTDMVSFDLDERFDLIYCVFNTIYALTDQETQAALLRNAARHLTANGSLVVETQLIGLSDFVNNKVLAPMLITPDRTEIVMIMHDPAGQILVRQTINFQTDGVFLAPLHALRLAFRAGSDGTPGRTAPDFPPWRMGGRGVHRQGQLRLGLPPRYDPAIRSSNGR